MYCILSEERKRMNIIGNYLFQKILKTPVWEQKDQSTIGNKVLIKITDFCCKYLPKSIRIHVLTILDMGIVLMLRVFKLTNQLNFSVFLIQGKEKNSGEKIKIIYLSNDELDGYISNILFCEVPKCEKIGESSIRNIERECEKFFSNIDAIFVKSDMFYSGFFEKRGFIIIPEWISLTLDIERPFETIYKNFSYSTKREIRKVKSYGFSHEISHDLEKLKLFYYKMYLPYTKKKHGELTICVNFHSMRHLFEMGYKLMLIKYNEEYVSGWLFFLKDKKYVAKYMGIMDGKAGLLKQGLGDAAFYFSILWAKKNGAKLINFGACKSFLHDGVFRYKRKWGTKVERADKLIFYDIFSFRVCSKSKGIQVFLEMNPFVCLKNNQLQEMVS